MTNSSGLLFNGFIRSFAAELDLEFLSAAGSFPERREDRLLRTD